jgi:hypothetical protein
MTRGAQEKAQRGTANMTDAKLIARTCRKCGTNFLPTPYQLRKCAYVCRACRTAQNKEWMRKRRLSGNPIKRNLEAVRFTNARRAARPEIKEKRRIAAAKRLQDPIQRPKIQARRKLRDAIKLGKIKKGSCERCGSQEVQAHHDDYSKPFEVRWLCSIHHAELHSKERLAQDQATYGVVTLPPKKTLAEHAVDHLRETGISGIMWGDVTLTHEILARANAPHRGPRSNRLLLNVLDKSPLFEKRLVRVGKRNLRSFELRGQPNV